VLVGAGANAAGAAVLLLQLVLVQVLRCAVLCRCWYWCCFGRDVARSSSNHRMTKLDMSMERGCPISHWKGYGEGGRKGKFGQTFRLINKEIRNIAVADFASGLPPCIVRHAPWRQSHKQGAWCMHPLLQRLVTGAKTRPVAGSICDYSGSLAPRVDSKYWSRQHSDEYSCSLSSSIDHIK